MIDQKIVQNVEEILENKQQITKIEESLIKNGEKIGEIQELGRSLADNLYIFYFCQFNDKSSIIAIIEFLICKINI